MGIGEAAATAQALPSVLHRPAKRTTTCGLPAGLTPSCAPTITTRARLKENKPFRLAALTAEELAKMPTYYIMDLDKGMARPWQK